MSCGNCPVNERTGNGILVGRCWLYLRWDEDGVPHCPRHGNVTDAVARYERTGTLTPEHQHLPKGDT